LRVGTGLRFVLLDRFIQSKFRERRTFLSKVQTSLDSVSSFPSPSAGSPPRRTGCSQRFGVIQKQLHALGHLQESGACSIAAAQRDLGYDPKIELEEGTRRAIRWCVETGQPI
jgi:hypothetical protein